MNVSGSATFGVGAGGSFSYGQGEGNSAWTDHPTTIEGTDGLTINVKNKTELTGSELTADNGKLNLNTGQLSYNNLHDFNKSSSFQVSLGATPSNGIAGSAGFSMNSSDKEGITRATIGQGQITTSSDLSGLNRDLAALQVTTKNDNSHINVLLPAVNPDQIVKEGRVVIPTALGIYASVWNTSVGAAISPLIFAEQSGLQKGNEVAAGKAVQYAVLRGYNSYYPAVDVGEAAYDNHPEYLPLLFSYQLPIIGTFLPSPTGNTTGRISDIVISGGINDTGKFYDINGNWVKNPLPGQQNFTRDGASYNALGVDASLQLPATYSYGSATETGSELFLGNTAPMLQYYEEVIARPEIEDGTTIAALAHSGGVIRSAGASKYLSYNDIGVNSAFFAQGPAIGFYNNIGAMNMNYSFGTTEPTSDLGLLLYPGLFSSGQLNFSSPLFNSNGIHTQFGVNGGTEFDEQAKNWIQTLMNQQNTKTK